MRQGHFKLSIKIISMGRNQIDNSAYAETP